MTRIMAGSCFSFSVASVSGRTESAPMLPTLGGARELEQQDDDVRSTKNKYLFIARCVRVVLLLLVRLSVSGIRNVAASTRCATVRRHGTVGRNTTQRCRRSRCKLTLSADQIVAASSLRFDLGARRHEKHSLDDARKLVHCKHVVRMRGCRSQTNTHVTKQLDQTGHNGLKTKIDISP